MALIPNSTYYYRVKAVTSDGESAYSDTTRVTTLSGVDAYTATTPVSVPIINKVKAYTYHCDIYISIPNSSENVINYIVEASTLSDFSTKAFTLHEKAKSALDVYDVDNDNRILTVNNLAANTTYYLRVKAANSLGSSNYSAAVTTLTYAFNGPKLIGVTDLTAVSAKLNWLPVQNSYTSPTYTVDVATDANFTSKVVDSQTTSNLYYQIPVLIENTIYYARVKATSSSLVSSWTTLTFTTLNGSDTVSALSSTLYPPVFKNPTLDTTRLTLNWYPISSTSTYHFQVSTASNFSSTIVDTDLTSLSYTVENLSEGVVYYYRIRTNGVVPSAYRSSSATTLTTTGLNPPLTSVINTLSKQVTLSIVTRTYSTYYAIDVSTSNSFTTFNRYYVSTDTLTVYNLSPNTTYYTRIKGLNNLNASDFSSTTSFTTSAALSAITVNAVSRLSENTVQLNWVSNNQYSKYLVNIQGTDSTALNSIFNNYDVGYVSSFYLDYLLTPKSVYSYQIVGVTSTGDKTYSDFYTFTTPDLPAKLAFSNGYLSWSNKVNTIELSNNEQFIGCVDGWIPNYVNTAFTTIPLSKLIENTSFYIRAKDNTNSAASYSNVINSSDIITTLDPEIGSNYITIRLNKSKYKDYKLTIVKIVSNNPVTVSNYLYPVYTNNYLFSFVNLDPNSDYLVTVSYLKDNEYKLVGQYTYKTYHVTNAFSSYTLDTNIAAPALTVTTIAATALYLTNTNNSLIAIEVSRSSTFNYVELYKQTTGDLYIETLEDSTYYIRAAVLDVNNTKYGTLYTATVTTPKNTPELVGSLSNVAITTVSVLNANEVMLTHSTSPNSLDYLIEISETNTFTLLASGITLTRTDTNKVLVSGLLPTKVYYGRISAYNRRYKTTYSATTTIDTTP